MQWSGRSMSRVWKWLGVAGVAGVAATGVVVARDQRRRAQLTPDQVRKQLHRRLADLDGRTPAAGTTPPARTTASVPVKRRRR